jgi:hypothetical protein
VQSRWVSAVHSPQRGEGIWRRSERRSCRRVRSGCRGDLSRSRIAEPAASSTNSSRTATQSSRIGHRTTRASKVRQAKHKTHPRYRVVTEDPSQALHRRGVGSRHPPREGSGAEQEGSRTECGGGRAEPPPREGGDIRGCRGGTSAPGVAGFAHPILAKPLHRCRRDARTAWGDAAGLAAASARAGTTSLEFDRSRSLASRRRPALNRPL